MNTYETIPFKVPDQLYAAVDDHVLEVHDLWQRYSLQDVGRMMPKPFPISHGEQTSRAVVLEPEGDIDTDVTGLLILPHQQAWKPTMFIRAEIDRQMNMPNSRMIVLPNDSLTDRYSSYSAAEKQDWKERGLQAVYEHKARVLGAYGLTGLVEVRGDSFGGLIALGLATVGSQNYNIVSLSADEMPNMERTPKQLQKDFLASGKWSWQKQSVADANIPSLSQAHSTPRLALDYARFGLATLTPTNKKIKQDMATPHVAQLITDAMHEYPDAAVKLSHAKFGYVRDSRMFDPAVVEGIPGIEVVGYTGEAARGHSTMDNPMASALSKRRVNN